MSHFAPLNRSELVGEFMLVSPFLLFIFFLSFPSFLLPFYLIEDSVLRVYFSPLFSPLFYLFSCLSDLNISYFLPFIAIFISTAYSRFHSL